MSSDRFYVWLLQPPHIPQRRSDGEVAELVEPDPADDAAALEDVDAKMRDGIDSDSLCCWMVSAQSHEYVHRRNIRRDVIEQDFVPLGETYGLAVVWIREGEVLSFVLYHPFRLKGEIADEVRRPENEQTVHVDLLQAQ